MSVPSADPLRRPPRWWMLRLLVVAGLFVGLILWLSRPGPPPSKTGASALLLLSGTPMDAAALEALATEDPAWLALPHPRGFSAAWLTNTTFPHQPYRWEPKDEWLEFNASTVGQTLSEYLRTNRIQLPHIWERPVPGFPLVTANPLVLRSKSEWEATGALAHRPLLDPLSLASWTNAQILRSSVVQLVVDSAGWTREARLLQSSGMAAADEAALRMAEGFRFRPSDSAGAGNSTSVHDTGHFVFRWHTLAAGVTNALEHPLPLRTVLPQ